MRCFLSIVGALLIASCSAETKTFSLDSISSFDGWEIKKLGESYNGECNYYYAYNYDFPVSRVIYSDDGIICENPYLRHVDFQFTNGKRFEFTYRDTSFIIDFNVIHNIEIEKKLKALPRKGLKWYGEDYNPYHTFDCMAHSLSQNENFSRFRREFGEELNKFSKMYHHISVDYPDFRGRSAENIRRWLVNKIESSIYRVHSSKQYVGSHKDYEAIAQYSAEKYFTEVKGNYADFEDGPSAYFNIHEMRVAVFNDRFITYQDYMCNSSLGMHPLYYQNFISYDHVNDREINAYYLFEDSTHNKVKELLIRAAYESGVFENESYEEVELRFVPSRFDIDKLDYVAIGTINDVELPNPILLNGKVMFYYPPYSLRAAFVQGDFYFSIPVKQLAPYMTRLGKWCTGLEY